MTREQALRHAATTAMRAEASVIDAPMTHALAHLAHAWVAIADRLPVVETWPPKSMPADKDVQRCGHGVIAWRNAGGAP